jgi:hypothetical protein
MVRWSFKCFRILAMVRVTLMYQLLTLAWNQMNDRVFLSCQSDLDWSLCWLHDLFLLSGEFRKTTYVVDPLYLLHLLELHPCWLLNMLHSSVVMKEILICCLLQQHFCYNNSNSCKIILDAQLVFTTVSRRKCFEYPNFSSLEYICSMSCIIFTDIKARNSICVKHIRRNSFKQIVTLEIIVHIILR